MTANPTTVLTSTASSSPVRLSKTEIEESPATASSADDLARGVKAALKIQLSPSNEVVLLTSCSAEDPAAYSRAAGRGASSASALVAAASSPISSVAAAVATTLWNKR